MINISQFLPWLSLIIGLIAVYSFIQQRRAYNMDQGKREGDILQLRKDMDHAFDKIELLEKSGVCTDNDLTELRTDMKHVLTALERIERRLENEPRP